MHTDPPVRAVVVRPEAAHLRRVLDASSWVVLEELLARSTGDATVSVTTASIRQLAESLGVAKDTIGRAVTRLRELGLIDYVQDRDATSGVFASTTYRITVPADMFSFDTAPATIVSTPIEPAARHRTRARTPQSHAQLSLLDV